MLYVLCFFFFNDTATTEIYTLSLHDALPISRRCGRLGWRGGEQREQTREQRHHGVPSRGRSRAQRTPGARSEEHTSELQSRFDLVCRLLLEKKKQLLDLFACLITLVWHITLL